ncbi:hypothetical protein L1887_62062 [Cichorium endivia]|nr:hypothetical protein L1887_62062 [Cichorium endivia]
MKAWIAPGGSLHLSLPRGQREQCGCRCPARVRASPARPPWPPLRARSSTDAACTLIACWPSWSCGAAAVPVLALGVSRPTFWAADSWPERAPASRTTLYLPVARVASYLLDRKQLSAIVCELHDPAWHDRDVWLVIVAIAQVPGDWNIASEWLSGCGGVEARRYSLEARPMLRVVRRDFCVQGPALKITTEGFHVPDAHALFCTLLGCNFAHFR